MIHIRPARADDLPAILDIWYAAEVAGDASPPPCPAVPPYLRHERETGHMYVAEHGDHLAGVLALIPRDDVCYIAEFFVRPDCQSAGIGKRLLQEALPHDGRTICTLSSAEFSALSSYARVGLRPLWPNFQLRIAAAQLGRLPTHDIEVVPAQPDDPHLIAWDAAISRRRRPADLAYLTREVEAIPLWFRRGGQVVGYGYVQMRSPESLRYPHAATVGPIGAHTAVDAGACACAAAAWACGRASQVRIPVPGPHHSLQPLLAAGFRMIYTETFMASAAGQLPDPACYIPTLTFF